MSDIKTVKFFRIKDISEKHRKIESTKNKKRLTEVSLFVPITLLKSNQFIEDLKQLYELNNLLSRNHYS